MQVETYEALEYETGEQAPEMEAEAIEIIELLGLEGQRKLLAGEGETQTRAPYRKLTAQEKRVYSVLCPESSSLEDFDACPIPLRVLQVAAHARELYDEVVVWCPRTEVDNDPVLIGRNSTGYYSHDEFLLARWGEVLLPFDELVEVAKEVWKKDSLSKARGAVANARAFIENIDSHVEQHIRGDYVHVPS